jgi:hypothetical protein
VKLKIKNKRKRERMQRRMAKITRARLMLNWRANWREKKI